MNPDHVMEVAAIRKAYGATVAVDDVSFTPRRGEIFGLSGGQKQRLFIVLALESEPEVVFREIARCGDAANPPAPRPARDEDLRPRAAQRDRLGRRAVLLFLVVGRIAIGGAGARAVQEAARATWRSCEPTCRCSSPYSLR